MLKGHTKIELTDMRTGKKRTIEKHNLVTDAVAQLFRVNPYGMSGGVIGAYTPIDTKCMGGLLLLEDEVVESTDQVYTPSTVHCTGYANMETYVESGDHRRGNYNTTESAATPTSRTFVWDFDTAHGNGVISALALTHPAAGMGYLYNSNGFKRVATRVSTGNAIDEKIADLIHNVIDVDIEGNSIKCVSLNTSEITVNDYRVPFSGVYLKSVINLTNDVVIRDTQSVDITELSIGAIRSYAAFKSKDGYYRIFIQTATNNDIVAIKLDPADKSFTSDTWSISTDYPLAGLSWSSWNSRSYNCALRDDYLYILLADKTGMCKINIDDDADITDVLFGFPGQPFEHSGYSAQSSTQTFFTPSAIITFGDHILGRNFIVDTNDTVIPAYFSNAAFANVERYFMFGTYALSFGILGTATYSYNHATNPSKYVGVMGLWHGPYLATINNLAAPIEKSASDTMKVSYTITEADENETPSESEI